MFLTTDSAYQPGQSGRPAGEQTNQNTYHSSYVLPSIPFRMYLPLLVFLIATDLVDL